MRGDAPIANGAAPPTHLLFAPHRSVERCTTSSRLEALSSGETMNFIIWLVVGGVIGWLASLMMKTDGQQGIILNVVVGIVGAMLGGWLISPLLGVGTINQDNFSMPALLVSFLGASILLAIVNLIRRGSVR
jgi:uncharacterized membrane protein YeaQ/YmgE (transglycosylase-associated protein family)